MISSISLGATLSLLLTAVNALPQAQQQAPSATQAAPIGSFTANVYSAMRNNPSVPAGVLISLPYQTTTVTVPGPVQTVTVTATPNVCFSSVATPQQPGNGPNGSPVQSSSVVIPTPSTIPAGVFPPGFQTASGGLLPFMPSGTGTGTYPLATGAFVSAVLPNIESSVAAEVQTLLNPLQSQLNALNIPTPQPVAVQQVTVTAQVSVPTTVVNIVQIPTTVTQTLSPLATPVSASSTIPAGTGLPIVPTSASVAPFPFPSGVSSGIFPTGTGFATGTGIYPTGVFPTGSLPSGTASWPQGTGAALPPQSSSVVSPPSGSSPQTGSHMGLLPGSSTQGSINR